ncbi:hypothetical protein Athai_05210 [Actinocatenispora thailandica]|uniref:Uncharacterized protein n=1 Tax=Actinocatenispora thailandica TaxID=227318 RepID=A0A7R7HUU6_9ACTN|nr:hypothetical protein Athai_05210 [Actinocatenispora thailandica]
MVDEYRGHRERADAVQRRPVRESCRALRHDLLLWCRGFSQVPCPTLPNGPPARGRLTELADPDGRSLRGGDVTNTAVRRVPNGMHRAAGTARLGA